MISGWNKSLSNTEANIVFLGDSLTCGGDWETYFPKMKICTLAVPGDSLEGVRQRAVMIETVKAKKSVCISWC